MNNKTFTTYGAELEKTIASKKTGEPHLVSQAYFVDLKKEAEKRKTFQKFHESDAKPGINIGVISNDLGEQGLDNGFNLLETALPVTTSLHDLKQRMWEDIKSSQKILTKEGGSVINMSIHPLGKRDWETYCKTVAPKRLYASLWFRGWDHAAGIDARAQNSPTAGVSVDKAADAVSVIIGAGAAFIALFGNSPYEEGGKSAYKESRLTMWSRMMKFAKVEGDRDTTGFPKKRFHTLAQYFSWMHGEDTGLFFVLGSTNYKHLGSSILTVVGYPSVLEYLSKPQWDAFELGELVGNFPPKPITISSHISHMEPLQFQQFTGARIRYKLKDTDTFNTQAFLTACKKENEPGVEELFSKHTEYMYIEGRDPGANFPDQELLEQGTEIAHSTYIAPATLQAGLLRNLDKTVAYIDSFPWEKLGKLREEAIAHGLSGEIDGTTTYDFAKRIVELAGEGLSKEEQTYLAYPEFVLQTKQNGADRAIAFVEKQKGILEKRLQEMVKSREVII